VYKDYECNLSFICLPITANISRIFFINDKMRYKHSRKSLFLNDSPFLAHILFNFPGARADLPTYSSFNRHHLF